MWGPSYGHVTDVTDVLARPRPNDRCPCRLHKLSFRDTHNDRPRVVTQVEFPGLTDINGEEELGCSGWSFTRTLMG